MGRPECARCDWCTLNRVVPIRTIVQLTTKYVNLSCAEIVQSSCARRLVENRDVDLLPCMESDGRSDSRGTARIAFIEPYVIDLY